MDSFKKLVIIGVVFVLTTVNSFALKAEYRFENCNGNATSKNHQGAGLNGTLKGDAKITLNGGQIQNGLTLSGDGMMSVEHSSDLDLIENLTISFWVNPKQKKRQALLVKGGAGSDKLGANAEYSLVLWEDGKFKYKHNGTADLFSNSIIPLNEWTHIVLVRDNGLKEVKIYVNGKFDTKVNYTIDPSSSGKEKLIIGSGKFYSSTMQNFKGSLDEIKIYNIALSESEIDGIYGDEVTKKHTTGECSAPHKSPEAVDDVSNLGIDGVVRVDVLSNDVVYDGDKCRLNSSGLSLVSINGSTLSDDNQSLKVPNEGIWSVWSDGTIEFVSDSNFYGNPTDIRYRVIDSCGGISNNASIHLNRIVVPTPMEVSTPTGNGTQYIGEDDLEGVGNCECDDYKSTIPTLSKLGAVTILILMGLLGAFFIREAKVDFSSNL